jgi:hypothetical protein
MISPADHHIEKVTPGPPTKPARRISNGPPPEHLMKMPDSL